MTLWVRPRVVSAQSRLLLVALIMTVLRVVCGAEIYGVAMQVHWHSGILPFMLLGVDVLSAGAGRPFI